MAKKKVAVLFSGGKDSCLALHKALQDGYDVKYLLTIIPKTQESFMFHTPYLGLLNRQAEELGIELIIKSTEAEKEKELKDLVELIKVVKDKVEGIVVGGIASDYQGSRIKKICNDFKLDFIAPILGYTPEKVWDELISEGFKVILTKIACEGIPKEMLGEEIDSKFLDKLKKLGEKYKFRIDFEGGEAESAVLFMPEFSREIKIKYNIISEGKYNHILDIKK